MKHMRKALALVLALIMTTLKCSGLGFWSVVIYMLIADTVEYGTYKTGMRAAGISFSLQTFVAKLKNGLIGSVVLLQSLCFSGVIGYTGQVIRKRFGFAPAIITVALILLNPLVMLTSMHPWKDTGFAVCALLLSTYCLQIVTTKGKWLGRPLNLICFAVVAVIAATVFYLALRPALTRAKLMPKL